MQRKRLTDTPQETDMGCHTDDLRSAIVASIFLYYIN